MLRAPLRAFVLFGLALVLAVLPGCKGCGAPAAAGGRPQVVVSIWPIYDVTKRVAGNDADVKLLLPPGQNEHHFDPTPKDIEAAARASVGVMVGLGLDPWMEKLMKDAAPKARLLKVGDRVPILTVKDEPIGDEEADEARKKGNGGDGGAQDDDDDHGHAHGHDAKDAGKKAEAHDDHDHEKGANDPHVWLDPARMRLIVRAIAEELGRADAAHAIAYRERATELDKALDALDKEAEARTKALGQKSFVTFHGSFQYFAERYRLNILAVIEPFPGSQPTGEYVKKVLSVIKAKKVPALFSEPQLDPRPAKVLADEAKIPLGVLDPVGGGPETDTYEKMIRYNVTQLEKHLK